jgi:hypothetical protein
MRRAIGVGLALLLTVGTSALGAAQRASAADEGIIPGQAIGTFHLGEDLSDVVNALGPIHSQDDVPGSTLSGYYWPLKRIGAIADRSTNKVVALVVSLDEDYQTEKGVGAGVEMDTVRAAYGTEDAVDSHEDDDTLVYDKLGVAFVVDRAGPLGRRVSVVFIFGPGQYKTIFEEQQ